MWVSPRFLYMEVTRDISCVFWPCFRSWPGWNQNVWKWSWRPWVERCQRKRAGPHTDTHRYTHTHTHAHTHTHTHTLFWGTETVSWVSRNIASQTLKSIGSLTRNISRHILCTSNKKCTLIEMAHILWMLTFVQRQSRIDNVSTPREHNIDFDIPQKKEDKFSQIVKYSCSR